jgi:tetratricopeptide (TPR) repeat protein
VAEDNRSEMNHRSDSKLSSYSSEKLKKSLDLARSISGRELSLDAKHFYDLGVAKYNSGTVKFNIDCEEEDDESIDKHRDEYKNEYKEAIGYLAQAIKLNSNYIDAHVLRASIYHELAEDEEEIEYIWRKIIDYEKVISICPKYCEAYFQLIEAYFQLADNIQRDEYFEAYIKYTQAYDRNIQTGSGCLPKKPDRENFKYNLKYCNRVIEVYNNLINAYPEYTEAYFQICNIKSYLEDYDGVIDACNRLSSFDNTNINAYYCRANANCRLENYDQMLDDYNYLIDILGNGSIADYCRRAGINYYLKDYDVAIKDCNSAMALDVDKSFVFQIYTVRNEIILSMGDLDGENRSRPKVELSRFLWDIAPIKLTYFTRYRNNHR